MRGAVAIERPPPKLKHKGSPATALRALDSVALNHYFSSTARTRVIVVFTDGELKDQVVSELRQTLDEENISMILVQFWGAQERVFGADGEPERYLPRPDAPAFLNGISVKLGAPVFVEEAFAEAAEALRERI